MNGSTQTLTIVVQRRYSIAPKRSMKAQGRYVQVFDLCDRNTPSFSSVGTDLSLILQIPDLRRYLTHVAGHDIKNSRGHKPKRPCSAFGLFSRDCAQSFARADEYRIELWLCTITLVLTVPQLRYGTPCPRLRDRSGRTKPR